MKYFNFKFKDLLVLSFLVLGFFTVTASETQAWSVQHNLTCSGGSCSIGSQVRYTYNGPDSVSPSGQINVSIFMFADDYPGACPNPRVIYSEQGGAFAQTTDMEPTCYTATQLQDGVWNNHTVTAPATPGNYNICISSGLGGNYTQPSSCHAFTVTAPSSGTINVGANIPGASWTITGPNYITGSGYSGSYYSRPTGSYNITWGGVAGYNTPSASSQYLGSGGTINFSGNYTPAAAPSVYLQFF